MGRFKVGDRVRIREDLKVNTQYDNLSLISEMAKYRGKEATIKEITGERDYILEESIFYWADEMLEPVEYTYEDLCNSPMGTKITFENGEALIKTEIRTYLSSSNEWRNAYCCRSTKDLRGLKDNWCDYGKIIKIEEPTYTTVYEFKEILDEKEKEYLSNVIRPFRDKVEYIKKFQYSGGDKEFLTIKVLNNKNGSLPNFKVNTMYKGMEVDKEYSLKELGL